MLPQKMQTALLGFAAALAVATVATAGERTETQQKYAESLWAFVVGQNYPGWAVAAEPVDQEFAPPAAAAAKSFLNAKARSGGEELPYGSLIVTEHYTADGDGPLAVTVSFRAREGYSDATGDWYWAHYLADGTVVKTVADKDPYAKRGFVTLLDEDGRLWVFRTDSPELADYLAQGELAKHVIRPAAGPEGKTLKSPDAETMMAYAAAAKGFVTLLEDERIWVFRDGAAELEDFRANGELAKHVIRPAAGPLGMTVKAPDAETLDAYLQAKGI